MKLALHRSITFWSGILVMAFICWSWRDSTRHVTEFEAGRFRVEHIFSGAFVGYIQTLHREPDAERWDLRESIFAPGELLEMKLRNPRWIKGLSEAQNQEFYENGTVGGWIPDPLVYYHSALRLKYSTPADWCLFLPHWLLLLTVAIPWSALLLWRAKRGPEL